MKMGWVIWLLTVALAGCTMRSTQRLQEQNAFLAGQNAAMQQQAAASFSGVTIVGAVQNSRVPWVAALTLAQAIATANYLAPHEPKDLLLTRQGETARLDPSVLFNGVVVPLEPGDVVEIR